MYRKLRLKNYLVILIMLTIASPVLAFETSIINDLSGRGETLLVDDRTIIMSYDLNIRRIDSVSPTIFDNEGFPYYFLETDQEIGVVYQVNNDRTFNLTTVSNPSNIGVSRYQSLFICTVSPVNMREYVSIVNDGSVCRNDYYAYNAGKISEGITKTLPVPSINGLPVTFEWYIGSGAGGGGGCICAPGVYAAYPWIQSTPISFDVNTQNSVQVAIDYRGGSGCSAYLWLDYKPASTWIVPVPVGTSSNYGSDTVDCNGGVCKVYATQDYPIKYTKYLDMQQVDNSVDMVSRIECLGQPFHGSTSGTYNFEIISPATCYCEGDYFCDDETTFYLDQNVTCENEIINENFTIYIPAEYKLTLINTTFNFNT